MTISNWLRELTTEYTPTTDEIKQAVDRTDSLGRLFRNSGFGVLDWELGGSCEKWTAIRPVDDVDMFVYLDGEAWLTRQGDRYQPSTVIRMFRERIEQARWIHIVNGHVQLRTQSRSLRVIYHKEGSVHIDIVPAIWVNQNPHRLVEIPDRENKRWIQTCVRRQANLLNKLDNGFHFLRRGIRLLKIWRNHHRLTLLRSYALELLAIHASMEGAPQSDVGIFRHTLERMVETGLRQPIVLPDIISHYDIPRHPMVIMDVGVRDNNVASGITAAERRKIVTVARKTLELLQEAGIALTAGKVRIARSRFRQAVGT